MNSMERNRTGVGSTPIIVKTKLSIAASMLLCILVLVVACGHVDQGRKIEFIYLALGTSDVIGVGAVPLTDGYVYLVNQDLEIRIPGTFLLMLAVPGARIESLREQVRLAKL